MKRRRVLSPPRFGFLRLTFVHAPSWRQAQLAERWQRHWVLIRKTGSIAYSTTNITALDAKYQTSTWAAADVDSKYETTRSFTTQKVNMWVNKGCGAERNRAALGNFAAYVQQQWSAMHEEDTTCTYCGQQFLPSMIEEHQEKCEHAGSTRHTGDMLDYLKDNRVLYNRLRNGDYCLQMEPKLEATGETRLNLVLIKEVTCNSCGLSFQANRLERHRRWECKWSCVDGTDETASRTRRPKLLAPSQGFKEFKDEIEFTSML